MLLSLLSLVLTASVAAADNAADDAKGPPPRVMILHGDNDGGLYLEYEAARFVKQRRTEQVKNGDNNETREVEVVVPVTEKRRLSLDDKTVTVYGSDGEKITAKALRRITPPVAVLVSADGKAVGYLYRKLLRDDGLIVAAPVLALSESFPPAETLTPPIRRPTPEQPRQQAIEQARQRAQQQAQLQALQQAQEQAKLQKQRLEKIGSDKSDDKTAVTTEEQQWLDEILATKKTEEEKQKFKSAWKDIFDHKDRKQIYEAIKEAKGR